ncbi:MAG: PhzF family phenazine biosynthesis isomerase, partial [Ignavibacteria bacterium]|nr:PhzF family phenazine biosynthesis isomerase [Ignavibacteria bacterium]
MIRQVDAFTDVPHTGNPAGVVTRADGLTDVQMQSIAREMALSETVFVLSPTLPSADLRIRWFTPKCEVRLCGHATIAAFHALAEDGMSGMDRVGSHRFTVETLSGVLPVTVERSPDSVE